MMPAQKAPVPESEVVRLWQQQMQKERMLEDTEGRLLEVVYPGRVNDSRGGDFKDAVITQGNSTLCGCIEIHSITSGWTAHGHHQDPAYNQVVLHVAMDSNQSGPVCTRLQNGRTVPTVILSVSENASKSAHGVGGLPCKSLGRKWDLDRLSESLDRAGDQRLVQKAERFAQDMIGSEPDQTLFEGVSEALGYSKNKLPFLKLARAASLHQIQEFQSKTAPEDQCHRIQAFLFGRAGLLPSQRSPGTINHSLPARFERFWQDFSEPVLVPSLGWELFKVRPGNYPVRRIAALGYLLCRFQAMGWLNALLNIIRRASCERAERILEPYLTVMGEEYWNDHYDFGLKSPAGLGCSLLGRERAAEIVVNVLLPFALAWSQKSGEVALSHQVYSIYHRYHRLESNSIERHMLQQLAVNRNLVSTARRQQGILHIYRSFCTQGKCGDCVFSG